MRKLQLKRFDKIFTTREIALANLHKYENDYADGEIMAAAYHSTSSKTDDDIMYIVGIFVKKDAVKHLFTIDVKELEDNITKIDGADVKLGNKYAEKTLTSPIVGETRETPVKTDTVNDSILKIVTILGKDEAVIGTTMSKLNTLSGKTVTEIESSGNTITCIKEIANDGTVKYNLETNSSNIDVSGLNLGLHYTPKQSGSAPTISLSSTKGETVDATDFIKDGMIQSVALDNTQKNIVITWNTDGGGSTTTIPLSSLANIYEFFAGDETHNVVFSTTDKTTDNTTIVKADVNMVDCGMYDDSADPT
jgi:hypothetical protein